ncbi:uncharacterized protein LOC125381597 [Haliotis rufescens]|uniref:uncharacterized protein LOC125381597 n=1 Tax=Haliotis rufescens TaxID=6454 RepID=UPI00201EE7D4|nr:uncharacterized protein LOC125381597 [Haliotis rufescens]
MAGVRQGCVLALIVLSCVTGKGKGLDVFVPHLIEVFSGQSVTFDVIYTPYTTSDDVTINVTKQTEELAVIKVGNGSMAQIQRFGNWSRRVKLQQLEEKFFVTLQTAAVGDDGDYVVTVKVNNALKEKRMHIGVLENPDNVNIEIVNGNPGPFPEKTPVQFMCSGVGGRPLGEITLARKTLGDVTYVPLMADLLNKTVDGREFNYTFERIVDQQDNGSMYVCQIHKGPFFLKTGPLKQSSPVELSVECEYLLLFCVIFFTPVFNGGLE